MNARAAHPGLTRRAALLCVAFIGYWLLALLLVGGLLAVPVMQSKVDHLDFGGIAAFGGALTLAWALRPRGWFAKRNNEKPVAWSEEHAQGAHALLRRVAKNVGVTTPFDLYVISDATASISATRNWLGTPRRLQVNIGLPLFAWLSESELGSVIAHEFGHFVGGDLKLGPWVYRTRQGIANTVHDLDESMLFLDAPFRWYGHWFLRLSSAVSRAQEYSADALAARCFGATAAAAALEKVVTLDALWSVYLDKELWPAVNAGARLPILDGFRRFERATWRADVARAVSEAQEKGPHPYDTHPTLDERMTALGIPRGRDPRRDHCLNLVDGEAVVEERLYQRVLNKELPTCTWENFGEKVLVPSEQQRFRGTFLDPSQCALTQLPALMADTDALWPRVSPKGMSFLSPEARRRHVHRVLRDWVIVSLAAQGFSTEVEPGAPLRQRKHTVVIEVDALLDAVKGGTTDAAAIGALLERAASS